MRVEPTFQALVADHAPVGDDLRGDFNVDRVHQAADAQVDPDAEDAARQRVRLLRRRGGGHVVVVPAKQGAHRRGQGPEPAAEESLDVRPRHVARRARAAIRPGRGARMLQPGAKDQRADQFARVDCAIPQQRQHRAQVGGRNPGLLRARQEDRPAHGQQPGVLRARHLVARQPARPVGQPLARAAGLVEVQDAGEAVEAVLGRAAEPQPDVDPRAPGEGARPVARALDGLPRQVGNVEAEPGEGQV